MVYFYYYCYRDLFVIYLYKFKNLYLIYTDDNINIIQIRKSIIFDREIWIIYYLDKIL